MASAFKLPGTSNNLIAMTVLFSALTTLLMTSTMVGAQTLGNNCTENINCTDLHQECSGAPTTCICMSGYITDGTTCRLPNNGEACNQVGCSSNLVCNSLMCGCTNEAVQYFDSDSNQCENKKGLGSACNDTFVPCLSTFECKSDKCQCKEGQYVENELTCHDRKGYSAICSPSNTNECKANLICISERCNCTEATHFYDIEQYFNCQLKKGHSETCNVDNPTSECLPAFPCQGNICECPDPQDNYYNGSQCVLKKEYKAQCDVNDVGECSPNTQCTNSLSKGQRCLCPSDKFFNSTSGPCTSLTELRIQTPVTATIRTTDSITFSWFAKQYDEPVLYRFKNPNSGTATASGGSISGLTSGTKYEFSVDSYLSADGYYSERSTTTVIGEFWTKKEYKAQCDVNNVEECSPNTQCTNSRSEGQRCLCPSDKFFKSTSGPCTSLTELRIQTPVTATIRTTDSITFSWSAKQYDEPVLYRLKNVNSGTISAASASGGTVHGLTSGTKYEFSVDSYLSADGYYLERSTTFDIPGEFWTKKEYKAPCDVNNVGECSSNTQCINSLSEGQRCLCPLGSFFQSTSGPCTSLTELRIQTPVTATIRTTDSITFSWSAKQYGEPVLYRLKNVNSGTISVASASGGTVHGLTSGTKYEFSVDSYLSADGYYSERSTTFDIPGEFWTKKEYKAQCDVNDVGECSPNTQCINSRSEGQRCLCPSDKFFKSTSGPCTSLTELRIQTPVTATIRTTVSITFSWSANQYGEPVLYRLKNVNGTISAASASGGTVHGLTSGTKYEFSVDSYLSADDYYSERSTTFDIPGEFWTKPSKPGSFDAAKSQLKSNPMTFGFQAASGNVDRYRVTIKIGQQQIIQKDTKVSELEELNLTPGEMYYYEIIAVNGLGDDSDMTTGNFKAESTVSGEVDDLKIDKKATSVLVQWKGPKEPNGDIHAFAVEVYRVDGTCLTLYTLSCDDCDNSTVPSSQCEESKTGTSFSKNDVTDENHVFSQNITSLITYTDYDIKVFAVNEKGSGTKKEKRVKTLGSVAADLESLEVTSSRNQITKLVGLSVVWIPGPQTGETDFTVIVVDLKDSSTVHNTSLKGYNRRNNNYDNVLAFHDYSVSVYAETKYGRSETLSQVTKTVTTNPGMIQGLSIDLDDRVAKKMSLKIDCPLENERNGAIEKYRVIKTTSSGDESPYTISSPLNGPIDCSTPFIVHSSQLGSFEILENYTFVVIAKNQDYEGDRSHMSVTFNVPIRAPILTFVVGKSDVEASDNTVSVSLCPGCLTNSNQGEVTHAGLIVCVKSTTNTCSKSRRKRSVMTVDTFLRYSSWGQAKATKFDEPYRTTPDNWLNTLKSGDPPKSYLIGNEKCPKDVGVYCNGPLQDGKEFVVIAIACTKAGCGESDAFVVKTKASEDNETDVGMIAGVVVAIILIAAIAVVAVFFYFKMRKNKNVENPHVQFDDLTPNDSRPIKIREFSDHVASMHKDANLLFQDQFEDIKNMSAELKFTHNEAQREHNRVKNRYVDILPYDHSRVKLAEISECEEGSDFINASFIPGLTSKREYIATQGPMHATIPHFWRMVWEQKSKVIVMLSDLMENNKMKVNLYWPENLNEPISYGDVLVEMTNFSQLNKYIIRNFKISVGNMTRRVTHFFIPGWWDFSANLTFDDVLEFAQLVRKETTPPGSGPPVVHCSAGVGRTGTFIALDYFMQYIDRQNLDDDIDVFKYVMEMRRSRPRMVQAETQYVFIFDALVEVIKRKIKAEDERLYDNCRPKEENIYANQMQTENIYANTPVTSADNTYANTNFGHDGGSNSKDTVTVDFSYTNEAFEPDHNYENVQLKDNDHLSSNDTPTTVL